MFSDQSAAIQELLVGGFVVFMMLSVGIDLTVERVREVFRKPAILISALTVNYVVVPIAFVLALKLFDIGGMWAVGLMFVAVAPGGPVAGVLIQNAGGNIALGASMIVVMNILNTVLTPIGFLSLESSAPTGLPMAGMVKTIILFQLLPLAAAMGFRHGQPDLADRYQPYIQQAAKVLLFGAAAVILAGEIPRLMTVPIKMIVFCHLAVPIMMGLGWLFTPGTRADRIAVSIATPYRSISVVLLLLASWVRDMDAMLAAMTYSGAMLWMCLAASTWMRRRWIS